MVHKDLPHGPGTKGKKMCAVLPLDLLSVHKTQIGFIDQRCGLKGLLAALACHQTPGDAMKFAVNQRGQAVKGFFVAVAPCLQQSRNLIRLRRVPHMSPPVKGCELHKGYHVERLERHGSRGIRNFFAGDVHFVLRFPPSILRAINQLDPLRIEARGKTIQIVHVN